MKLSHLAAFEKHLESAGEERLPPVYLIIGKDHPEAMEAAKALILQSKRETARYSSDKLSLETLSSELYSSSLFSGKRLLLIDKADKGKEGIKECLLAFLDRPGEPLLVLVAESFLPQSKLYKKIETIGVVLNLQGGKPWEMEPKRIQWLLEKAKADGKQLDPQVAKAFVARVGTEYSALCQEYAKLLCYTGSEQIISLQAVEAITLKVGQETVWQLGDAILAKNISLALQVTKTLEQEGTPLIMTLRALRKQFSTKLSGQNSETLKKSLVAIDAAELQAKNSGTSESLLMDLLLTKLVRA